MIRRSLYAAVALVLALSTPLVGAAPKPTPIIVAKVSATVQTRNIPQTVLFAPAATDSQDYRVSVYTVQTSTSSTCTVGSGWDVSLFWTDEFRVNMLTDLTTGTCNSQASQNTFVLHVLHGTSISFAVNLSSPPQPVTYDVFITVEEL